MFLLAAVNSSKVHYNTDAETATILFPSMLPLGEGKLSIAFSGELNDKMKGFYRSKYKNLQGEEKYCAVTQFEVSFSHILHNIFLTFSLKIKSTAVHKGKNHRAAV